MARRLIAILLIVLALGIVAMSSALAFTPWGAHLLGQIAPPTPTPTPIPFTPAPTPPPTPILTVRGTPPAVGSHAAYLLDMDTDHTLVDINGEQTMPMASTTKIMTALIAIQSGNLDQIVTIGRDAYNEVHLRDGSSANLVVGDKIALKDLLYGLMLPSGDDAAVAIADALGGMQQNFVQRMNLFAYRLRLFQTHYLNSDGLTEYDANGQPLPGHYTSAADLAHLARYAMSIPLFAQIVQTQHYHLAASAIHADYQWDSTNELLASYKGATGIKTGHTVEAGYCLVFSATQAEHHLLGVVLDNADSEPRFTDARKLLDWGFQLPLLPPS